MKTQPKPEDEPREGYHWLKVPPWVYGIDEKTGKAIIPKAGVDWPAGQVIKEDGRATAEFYTSFSPEEILEFRKAHYYRHWIEVPIKYVSYTKGFFLLEGEGVRRGKRVDRRTGKPI